METSGQVIGRATTNSAGWARIETGWKGRVALESGDSNRAARMEFDSVPTLSTELRLERAATCDISAIVPGEAVRWVSLVGTGIVAHPGMDGKWHMTGVATGTYAVAAGTDSGVALLGRIGIDTTRSLDTLLVADADSVLLEDFAVQDGRNRYGRLLGAGWWYTTTDAIDGGRSTTSPADPYGDRVPCPDGKCLSMSFSVDTSFSGAFALVGMDLDRSYAPGSSSPHLADLSSVDALGFDASGSGTFQIQIHFASATGSQACVAAVELDGNWRRRRIPMSDFVCDEIPTDRKAAIGIVWLAQADASLLLGKVVLSGAGPRKVFPALNQGSSP
jgi:hypothetical protein